MMVVGFMCGASNPKSFLSRLRRQQRFVGAGCVRGLITHKGWCKRKTECLFAKASQLQNLVVQVFRACEYDRFGLHDVSLRLRFKVSTNIDVV